ncbi:MAG: uroporphyrinogen-III C-methyltransferase [Gemmatimonadetes bacterium]|nr:uroporphyrinogen-III C-methyltransferase [Gemmatimonadota bacterium]
MGSVYLVGAGPGDPKLLTLRAAELLAAADFVVYDALVHPAILEHAPERAERQFVGKRGGETSVSQETITSLLVELAGRYEVVVRLKGGDPFVFGRGGEEAEALALAGVRFEVVPGVTAGIAAPAYAGIPVTHRGLASCVTFVTGHEDPTKESSDLDWAHLARVGGTIVFYMGVRRMEENLGRLVAAGRSPDTPAALVEWGTYPRQRTLTATIGTLVGEAERAGVGAPALVIVGDVVTMRERLRWFESRPLFGRRILVTRARAQASGFAAQLEALGAEVIQFPTIRITGPADAEPLRAAVKQVDGYDWVVFTSVNGVERFWREMRSSGRDARSLAGVHLCAIGPATAAALELEGVRADLVPAQFISEAVADALADEVDLTGARILLPRAEVSREALPALLRERGATVDEVAAYRTVPDSREAAELRIQRGPEPAQPGVVGRALAQVGGHRVAIAPHDQLGAVRQRPVEVVQHSPDRARGRADQGAATSRCRRSREQRRVQAFGWKLSQGSCDESPGKPRCRPTMRLRSRSLPGPPAAS